MPPCSPTADPRTFKPKVEFLYKIGFKGPLLRDLLRGSPETMKLSKRQIERRWKFLHMVVGASEQEVASESRVMLMSVFDDIGPAYSYFKSLSDVNQRQVGSSSINS